MSRDGAGNYSLPEAPYQDGQVIDDDSVNANFADIATALTGSMARDGQSPPTADMPWGGRKITGLGAGTNDDDAVRYDQVATLARPGIATFEDYGAVGDGVTDDGPEIQAALDSGAKLVQGKPGSTYYTAQTITIPDGVVVDGMMFLPGNPAQGTQIIGGTAVSPVIQLTDGGSNTATGLRNITIGRVSGTPNSARIGIKVFDGFSQQIENVHSDNHGINWQFEANPGSGGLGLGVNLVNCHSSRAVDTHIDIDSWPELYWNGGRIGTNGSGDYAATCYVRIRGGATGTAGGPNTIKFLGVQFNQGSATPSYFCEFVSLADPYPGVGATIFLFDACHVENVGTAIFRSDSTWNIIDNLALDHCFINTPATDAFALNAGSQIYNWEISHTLWPCSGFDIASTAQINNLNITGGWIGGPMSITPGGTGSVMKMIGTQHTGNAVFTGTYGRLTLLGNSHYSGATDISGADGVIVTHDEGNWTPLLAINGSTTGITQSVSTGSYQLFGRVMTVTFNVTLTSKGASTGNVTITGLPVAEYSAGGTGGAALTHFLNCTGLTGTVIANNSASTTIMYLFDSVATDVTPLTDANLTNTSVFKGTLSYFVR